MQIPLRGIGGKYPERPPPCLLCASPSWWDGTRTVSSVCKQGDCVQHRTGLMRRRACCSRQDCPQKSWTVYPQHDWYPHRLFGLEVVISAVGAVVFGKLSMTAAARGHLCCRDSIRRWVRWVERLAEPADLMRACTRLEPSGLPGAAVSAELPRAAAVLHLLDRLAQLLAQRGVRLSLPGSGFICVLKEQLTRFGQVFYLTKLSPPLRADLSGVRL